jgi:hypothetical protein
VSCRNCPTLNPGVWSSSWAWLMNHRSRPSAVIRSVLVSTLRRGRATIRSHCDERRPPRWAILVEAQPKQAFTPASASPTRSPADSTARRVSGSKRIHATRGAGQWRVGRPGWVSGSLPPAERPMQLELSPRFFRRSGRRRRYHRRSSEQGRAAMPPTTFAGVLRCPPARLGP